MNAYPCSTYTYAIPIHQHFQQNNILNASKFNTISAKIKQMKLLIMFYMYGLETQTVIPNEPLTLLFNKLVVFEKVYEIGIEPKQHVLI